MDNYIDRQAAIDAISKKQDGVFDQDAEIDTAVLYVYSECKAIIKDLPSAQPRKGEWIYSEGLGYGNPYGHYECSLCGDGYGYKTNFCPNCGCRMEEGDAE